jgi:hypothetical protein
MTITGRARRLAELVAVAETHGGSARWLAAHTLLRELQANLHERVRYEVRLNDNPEAKAKLTDARQNLRRGLPAGARRV